MVSFRRKPDFPENAALVKAIINLATQQTPENYLAFYTEILKSDLLLAGEANQPQPILQVDEKDRIILPLFTDVERVKKVYPDAGRVGKMPVRDIFRIAVKNNYYQVNINPEIGPGAFLTFDEISHLANGEIPDPPSRGKNDLGEGTFVPMGDSQLPSEAMMDKMIQKAQALLEQEAKVEMGFVILMGSDTGRSQLTIALRAQAGTDLNQLPSFSQNFVNAVEAVLKQPLRLMWMDDQSYSSISKYSKPFYVRGKP
jgi:hypothetical protein